MNYYSNEFSIVICTDKIIETIKTRYHSIMELLKIDRPAIRKHKDRLFGPAHNIIVDAPILWWECEAAKALGIIGEWRNLTLREKGKYIAYLQVYSMMETLKRHLEILDENNKQAEKDASKQNV